MELALRIHSNDSPKNLSTLLDDMREFNGDGRGVPGEEKSAGDKRWTRGETEGDTAAEVRTGGVDRRSVKETFLFSGNGGGGAEPAGDGVWLCLHDDDDWCITALLPSQIGVRSRGDDDDDGSGGREELPLKVAFGAEWCLAVVVHRSWARPEPEGRTAAATVADRRFRHRNSRGRSFSRSRNTRRITGWNSDVVMTYKPEVTINQSANVDFDTRNAKMAATSYGKWRATKTTPTIVRSFVTRRSAEISSVSGFPLPLAALFRSLRTTDETDETLLLETLLRRELHETLTASRVRELCR